MFPLRHALPIAFFSVPVVFAACAGSGDDNGGSPDGSDDVSTLDATKDARKDSPIDRFKPDLGTDTSTDGGDDSIGDDTGDDSMEASLPLIRVAHLVPDLPSFDVCFVPTQGMPIGPVLNANGLPPGMGYSQVTGYLGVPTGSYKVRLVQPFTNDCTKTMGVPDGAATIMDGSQSTLMIVGMNAPTGNQQKLQMIELTDETFGSPQNVDVRFVNVMPDTPSVDIGDLDPQNSMASLVIPNVPFGAGPMAGVLTFNEFYQVTIDSSGYASFQQGETLNPPVTVSVSAGDGAANNALVSSAMPNLATGVVQTAFITGLAAEKPKVPEVILCSDSSTACTPPLCMCHSL
jgi:hypothetical protein